MKNKINIQLFTWSNKDQMYLAKKNFLNKLNIHNYLKYETNKDYTFINNSDRDIFIDITNFYTKKQRKWECLVYTAKENWHLYSQYVYTVQMKSKSINYIEEIINLSNLDVSVYNKTYSLSRWWQILKDKSIKKINLYILCDYNEKDEILNFCNENKYNIIEWINFTLKNKLNKERFIKEKNNDLFKKYILLCNEDETIVSSLIDETPLKYSYFWVNQYWYNFWKELNFEYKMNIYNQLNDLWIWEYLYLRNDYSLIVDDVQNNLTHFITWDIEDDFHIKQYFIPYCNNNFEYLITTFNLEDQFNNLINKFWLKKIKKLLHLTFKESNSLDLNQEEIKNENKIIDKFLNKFLIKRIEKYLQEKL